VIAAVVVTYAAPAEALRRCLDAVVPEVDAVVVVDTGGSADVGRSGGVELLRVPNDGYGAAANAGFARARALGAATIVLLNDDVVGRTGWVRPLVDALATNGVGAAQPVLLVAGSEPPIVNSLGVRVGGDGAGTDAGDGDPYEPATGTAAIELFTGGAVAFATAFLDDTGGFDTRWFLYYEDIDLGRRGAELGWRYLLVHDSVVDHERGSTTAGQPDLTRYLQERNRLWAAFRFADPGTIARAVLLSVRRLRHAPRSVHARALAAGLAGAPRQLARRVRRVRRA
jgi:GT2 family glycosyltransferase